MLGEYIADIGNDEYDLREAENRTSCRESYWCNAVAFKLVVKVSVKFHGSVIRRRFSKLSVS